jgi:hypothetical protein
MFIECLFKNPTPNSALPSKRTKNVSGALTYAGMRAYQTKRSETTKTGVGGDDHDVIYFLVLATVEFDSKSAANFSVYMKGKSTLK